MKILNIAFVEDNEDDRSNVKDYFKQYEDKTGVKLDVHFFEYAELLFENYHSSYDVIFFDIELKGMDGLKAARKLRNIDPKVTEKLVKFSNNL